MSTIRWLLIVPVSIMSWYLMFTIGMELLGAAQRFCSEDEMLNGRCVAPWYANTKDTIIVILAGLSAVIVVFVAYHLAPVRKDTTAIAACLLGSAAATYVLIQTGSLAEYIAAITGGILTTLFVSRRELFVRRS